MALLIYRNNFRFFVKSDSFSVCVGVCVQRNRLYLQCDSGLLILATRPNWSRFSDFGIIVLLLQEWLTHIMLAVDKGLTGDWLATAWELEFGAGGAEIIEIGGVTLKGLIYNGMILIVHRAHHVSGRIVWVADELLLLLWLLLHPLLLLTRRCTVLGLAQLHGWRIIGRWARLAVSHLNAVWWWWLESLGSNGKFIAAIGCTSPVKFALLFLSTNAESSKSWSPTVLCL